MVETYLVTGGAGFIGSHFIKKLLKTRENVKIINVDLLTYAGGIDNLEEIYSDPRHIFVKGDVRDAKLINQLAEKADYIVHFAAETHVDRSILSAGTFVLTDVFGTYVVLEAARRAGRVRRFLHISTDEVYGSIHEGKFDENSPLNPSSPYAASKAGADRLAFAFYKTYGLPVIIARPSNNFGPNQHPEKAIPLFITNAIDDLPIPLYGTGENVRDWLYVEDDVDALLLLLEKGEPGQVYNIAASNEVKNIDLAKMILDYLRKPHSLISFVKDRPGHDYRYSMNWDKIKNLGWQPKWKFEKALEKTVKWYVKNERWWRKRKESREFKEYYNKNYFEKEGLN